MDFSFVVPVLAIGSVVGVVIYAYKHHKLDRALTAVKTDVLQVTQSIKADVSKVKDDAAAAASKAQSAMNVSAIALKQQQTGGGSVVVTPAPAPAPAPSPAVAPARDPHYLYPGDAGYPSGGPAEFLQLPVVNPANPPVAPGSGDGKVAPPEFDPALLLAARTYRVATSVFGSNDPRTIGYGATLFAMPNAAAAFQYVGNNGYDGTAEGSLYVQLGGK